MSSVQQQQYKQMVTLKFLQSIFFVLRVESFMSFVSKSVLVQFLPLLVISFVSGKLIFFIVNEENWSQQNICN